MKVSYQNKIFNPPIWGVGGKNMDKKLIIAIERVLRRAERALLQD